MIISTIRILPYAFHGREDLKEVILDEHVEEIGEGAFFHCASLKKIYVGRHVKKIGADAFSQISKNADFIWLGKAPYRSMLVRLLPPLTRVKGICAPYASFQKASEEEKLVLAIGWILHPEQEALFEAEAKKEYCSYVRDQLPDHAAELCEKDAIYEVLCGLWERRLLRAGLEDYPDFEKNIEIVTEKETDVIRQFLSYARSRKITEEQKKRLDQIEREAGLLEKKGSVFSGQYERDKHLLRRIRAQVSDDALRTTMESLGLGELPKVYYRDEPKREEAYGEASREPKSTGEYYNASREPAPAEILKFIIYSYVSQWNPASPIPVFERVPLADELAEQLDQQSFKEALMKCICPYLEERTVRYPRRMIPIIRFANEEGIRKCVSLRKEWSNYDIYGQSGYQACAVIDQAMLLSDCREARIFLAINGRLGDYVAWQRRYEASLHSYEDSNMEAVPYRRRDDIIRDISCRRDEEDALFWELLLWLEKEKRPELHAMLARYQERLYESYLSGRRMRFGEFTETRLASSTVRKRLAEFLFERCQRVPDTKGTKKDIQDMHLLNLRESDLDRTFSGRTFFTISENDPEDEKGNPLSIAPEEEICVAYPSDLTELQLLKWSTYFADKDQETGDAEDVRKTLRNASFPEKTFRQLHETDRSCTPDNYALWKNRYRDLLVPVQAILSLADKGMRLEGQPSGGIRISFHRKVIMTAVADQIQSSRRAESNETLILARRAKSNETISLAETRQTMRLGELLLADYTQREVHEILYLLDEAFCFELLLEGRIKVLPFLERFDRKQSERILEASIAAGNHENAALLLEHLKKLKGSGKSSLFNGEQISLKSGGESSPVYKKQDQESWWDGDDELDW